MLSGVISLIYKFSLLQITMSVHHPHVITCALIMMATINAPVEMDMYWETADFVMVCLYTYCMCV